MELSNINRGAISPLSALEVDAFDAFLTLPNNDLISQNMPKHYRGSGGPSYNPGASSNRTANPGGALDAMGGDAERARRYARELTASQAEVSRLRTQVDQLKETNSNLNLEGAETRGKLLSLAMDYQRLENKYDDKKLDLDDANKTIGRLETEIANHRHTITADNIEIRNLNNDKRELTNKVSRRDQTIRELRDSVENLKQAARSLRQRLSLYERPSR